MQWGVLGRSILIASALAATPAAAADLSFRGTFEFDDDIQFIDFTVGALSTVTIRTLSYAGGINAAGEVIPRGGFDPGLALAHPSGEIISVGDDSTFLPEDRLTRQRYDVQLEVELDSGSYRLALSQYDNSVSGPSFDHAFTRTDAGNFTPALTGCGADRFCDSSGVSPWNRRTGEWAVDLLNVASAVVVQSPVPEPSSWAVFALGLGLLALRPRVRDQDAPHSPRRP
jgi:hypothetical protein